MTPDVHRIVVPLLAALLLLPACTDDRISLAYGLEPGRQLEYRLTLDAEVERVIAGEPRTQRVRATFQAGQEIVASLPDGGASARLSLVPERLEVDGQSVRVGPGQEFDVELGPDGGLREIGRPTGEATEELAPVGLERLLPRLRPVLPAEEVAPGDAWRSATNFVDQGGRFAVETRSRLAELGPVADMPAALVRSTYVSPVDRREVFANAVADLEGRDVGVQAAWFSLRGFLLRATGDSVGRYAVTFRPPGGDAGLEPVTGGLEVRLHTEMELVSGSL